MLEGIIHVEKLEKYVPTLSSNLEPAKLENESVAQYHPCESVSLHSGWKTTLECHEYTNIASIGKLASANTTEKYVHVFSATNPDYVRRPSQSCM